MKNTKKATITKTDTAASMGRLPSGGGTLMCRARACRASSCDCSGPCDQPPVRVRTWTSCCREWPPQWRLRGGWERSLRRKVTHAGGLCLPCRFLTHLANNQRTPVTPGSCRGHRVTPWIRRGRRTDDEPTRSDDYRGAGGRAHGGGWCRGNTDDLGRAGCSTRHLRCGNGHGRQRAGVAAGGEDPLHCHGRAVIGNTHQLFAAAASGSAGLVLAGRTGCGNRHVLIGGRGCR